MSAPETPTAPDQPVFEPRRGEDPDLTKAAEALFKQAQEKGLPSVEAPPSLRPPPGDPRMDPLTPPVVRDVDAELQRAQNPAPAEAAPSSPAPEEPEAPSPDEPQTPSEGAEPSAGADEPGEPMIDLGEGQEVPVVELVQGYLRQSDYTKKTQELSAQRQSLNQEREQANLQMQQAIGYVGQLAQQLEQEINQSSNLANMEALRHSDPAEWAARQAEMQRKQQTVAMARAAQQQLEQQQIQARIPQERAALAAKDTDFAKDFDGTYRAVGKWITSERGGLSAEEWDQVYDHRQILIAKRAMEYDQATRTGAPRATQLARKPRVIRPGTTRPSPSAGEAATQDYQAALAAMREDSSIDNIARSFLMKERARRAQQGSGGR